MSTILAKIAQRIPHAREARSFAPSPRYRVRCDHCGRVYVVAAYPSQLRALRRCKACVEPQPWANGRYVARST